MDSPHANGWSIKQKQTGVDDATLAGSISANARGRGLDLQPLVDDIEELVVVTAAAEVVSCSREKNKELSTLVTGGYGLFAIIYSVSRLPA